MNEPSIFNPHTFNNACKTFPPDVVLYDHGRYTPHGQIHNAYGMLMARASYEGISRLMPGKRPFLLSRAGFSGIQRYAAVWTGDNTSSFAHLSLQHPMLLNMGLSGLAFSGADIGGFAGSVTPELLVKWYAAATFMPLMREHADQFALPQEPWAFGEPYTSMIRSLIELRYRLLPYLYAIFYEAHTTGVPVLRPLVMEYQDDPSVRNIADEFLVGEHLLIAPVLEEKAQGRSVYLPQGVWYELGSKGIHQGSQWIYRNAPLGTLPVFVKEGAVIASVEPNANTVGLLEKPIKLDIYPLKRPLEAESRLVLDDGVSLQEDSRQTFRFIQRVSPSGIILDIESSGSPFYRHADFRVHVYGESPNYTKVDGKNVALSFTEDGFDFSLPANSRRVDIGFGLNLR
jgi:alpha-glucosidase